MLMREDELLDEVTTFEEPEAPNLEEQEQPAEPSEPAPPIESRFLFVNVAAQRAKQLRKGVFPRLDAEELARLESSKAERLAMEEVRRGLVYYDLREWTPTRWEPVVDPPAKRRARR
jgi:DNA-directed RNA polymerase subunit K/omega